MQISINYFAVCYYFLPFFSLLRSLVSHCTSGSALLHPFKAGLLWELTSIFNKFCTKLMIALQTWGAMLEELLRKKANSNSRLLVSWGKLLLSWAKLGLFTAIPLVQRNVFYLRIPKERVISVEVMPFLFLLMIDCSACWSPSISTIACMCNG